MKRSSRRTFAVAIIVSALTSISVVPSSSITKIPIRDISKSIAIQDAPEIVGLARLKDNLALAGVDSTEKSWVALLSQEGNEIWRISPIVAGKGGDGFITAISADARGVLVSGLTQNDLEVDQEANPIASPEPETPVQTPTPSNSPTESPPGSPVPSAAPSAAPSASVPVVNPDNVIPIEEKPFRDDIANLFLMRIDISGKIMSVFNYENREGFIPRSIVTSGSRTFIIGNEQRGESGNRGAIYLFTEKGFDKSFTFGAEKTTFTRAVTPNTKSLIVVGSSADTIANKKVVGKADAIILTLSQKSGKISKIVRSSGAGAVRSWDFASGNILVSGTSRVKNSRETVVTSFTAAGKVAWTTRFPKSKSSIAVGDCIAISLVSNSAGLPFTIKGPEVFLYSVDSKGKRIQGLRLPKQELIALSTSASKGCAVLTRSTNAGVRLSFL